jgi:hypothetical protein
MILSDSSRLRRLFSFHLVGTAPESKVGLYVRCAILKVIVYDKVGNFYGTLLRKLLVIFMSLNAMSTPDIVMFKTVTMTLVYVKKCVCL